MGGSAQEEVAFPLKAAWGLDFGGEAVIPKHVFESVHAVAERSEAKWKLIDFAREEHELHPDPHLSALTQMQGGEHLLPQARF